MATRLCWTILAATIFMPAPALADGSEASLIHGCVHRVAGNVRIVAPAESCRPQESSVHWDAQRGSLATRGVQLFETDGSFTVPPGVSSVVVELWGGGGAGGLPPGPSPVMAGGGGGGGYMRTVMAVAPGQVLPIIVGLGGAASCGVNGGDGGDTSFGTLATARGGKGGTVAGQGGAGGLADPGGISYSGDVGVTPTLAGGSGHSAQGSFAPPGRNPGRGGISILAPLTQNCSAVELQFATGQAGQLIVQW